MKVALLQLLQQFLLFFSKAQNWVGEFWYESGVIATVYLQALHVFSV